MGYSLESAQALFDQGNYIAATKLCAELLNFNNDSEEEQHAKTSFAVKCLIAGLGVNGIIDDKIMDGIISTLKTACSTARTIDDLVSLNWETLSTLEDTIPRVHIAWLEKLQKNPTLAQYQDYPNLNYKLAVLRVNIQSTIRTCPLVTTLAEEAGVPLADYRKTNFDPCPEIYPEEKLADIEYEYVKRIYDSFIAYFEKNQHCTIDFSQKLGPTAIQCCFMLSILAGSVDDKSKGASKTIQKERLLKHAEILNFILNAVIYANGNTIPVLGVESSRSSSLKDLNAVYHKIQTIDPGFVPPQLPPSSIEVKRVNQSGGCYVATAVYGSYDCPQVWTLRRYRDDTLAATWYGRAFIRTYYAISPTLVKWFGQADWFKNLWKPRLDRMVDKLRQKGVENTPYQDMDW